MERDNVLCVCTLTVEYYSVLEKEGNLAICDIYLKVGDIILNEISQTEKVKYHMISHICKIKIKSQQKKTQAHRYREQIGGCQR